MRAISDRKLPEPYRSWINRAAPLPPSVRLLPRTVNVVTDLLFFLLLGIMFGGMGGLFLLVMPPWRFHPATDGWWPILFLGGIVLVLWLVPLLLLRRLCLTIGAHRDLKRGTLRQGVFLGPEGILVRMEPNRCHPIAADRFVVARLFPPERSRDTRQPALIIETLDGNFDSFSDRVAAHPDEINRAARELWPWWRKPKPRERADRQRRKDVQTPREMRRAAFLFAGSLLTVFGALAGIIASGDKSIAAQNFSLVLLVGLLLLAGAVVNLGYWFLRFKLSYRCPECRSKATRVDEALPDIHYYCPACNIEWDTGLVERPGRSD